MRVTANVGGVVREDYDPLASQRWLDSQRVAFTLGLNAEADQHAASRQAADLAFRQSADVEQNRSSFSPVAPTVFSRLYDKAVAYGDSRSEDDRIFSPISYRLGTRYWPARILAGIGDVIAGFEGLSNRQWNGGFDQGNNPFTQQSRWGVENQDVRLNVAANAALVVVSGAESFAAKGMTAGASTDTFSASERVIVSESAEALANVKTVGGGALPPASGTMPAASGRIGAASADQTFTLNSVVYRLEESRYSLAGEYAGSTSPGYLSRGGDSLALRLEAQKFSPNTADLGAGAKSFKIGQDLIHFEKHSDEIAQTLGLNSYSVSQYVSDANWVINNGAYAPELNAYVSIPGGTGSAKGLMVGLDRSTGEITTMHMKPVSWFEVKAPSLGWKAQPRSISTDLIGPNPQQGWRPPYEKLEGL